jgi:hypothetical protein
MNKKKDSIVSNTKKVRLNTSGKRDINNNNNNNNNNKNNRDKDKRIENEDEEVGSDGIYKELQIEDHVLHNKDNLKEWFEMLKKSEYINTQKKRTYYEISRKHSHDFPEVPLKKYLSCQKNEDVKEKKNNVRGKYIINSEIETFIIKSTNSYNSIIRLCIHLRDCSSYSCIALVQSDMMKNRGLFFKYFKKYDNFYIGVIDVHLGVFYSAIIFKCNDDSVIEDSSTSETIICDVIEDDYSNILKDTIKYVDMFFFCCDCV